MKKITLAGILMLTISVSTNAQTGLLQENTTGLEFSNATHDLIYKMNAWSEDSFVNKKDFYLEKSKDQKTTAAFMIAGGTLFVAAGLLVAFRKHPHDYDKEKALVLCGGGIALYAGSIALFLSAKKYAVRASLAFNIQQTPSVIDLKNKKRMPALCLNIPLGK